MFRRCTWTSKRCMRRVDQTMPEDGTFDVRRVTDGGLKIVQWCLRCIIPTLFGKELSKNKVKKTCQWC